MTWVMLQAKIDIPLHLCEYAFIDEDDYKFKGKGKRQGIPPPPPPPTNNINKLLKIGLSKQAIEHKMKMEKVTLNVDDLKNVCLKKLFFTKKLNQKINY